MKLGTFIIGAVIGFSLVETGVVWADPTPVVVPPNQADRDQIKDLKGAPADVKNLISNFDTTRDKYLAQQRVLLAKLKGANQDQRNQIRADLQANHDAFLAELKSFRSQITDELNELKGKISHQEFQRIIDAAHNAVGEGARHKGHK